MPFVGGLNMHITNPRWRTATILRNRKIAISQQWFDRSPRNLGMVTQFGPLERLRPLKFQKFKNPRFRHDIWYDDAGWPSWPFRPSDFRPEVEIKQCHTFALKNDTVGHNGLGYGADTTFHNVFLVLKTFYFALLAIVIGFYSISPVVTAWLILSV